MYKLTIVAGPGRGNSFGLHEGENAIGRQSGNTVMLSSARVSKRHCVVVLVAGRLMVRDEESANGTFVNGTMAKEKEVQLGDRISVGEFVLQVARASAKVKQPARPSHQGGASGSNVLPIRRATGFEEFSAFDGNAALAIPAAAVAYTGDPLSTADVMPRGLLGKLVWLFEKRVMPLFYRALLKSEWKYLSAAVVGFALCIGLFLVMAPVLESGRSTLLAEVGRRARFMAQQIADQNAAIVQSGALSQARVGTYPSSLAVKVAALLSLEDGRVLAANLEIPGGYLTQGVEGRTAVVVSKAVRDGKLNGPFVRALENDVVVAAVPVEVYEPRLARNMPRALALVSVDASMYTRGSGEVGIIYGQALVVLALLIGFALLILYRLTLKPFEVLNEEMDKVLKGELSEVTQEFKWVELNPIWELINSTFQRVPKGGGLSDSSLDATTNPAATAEDAVAAVRMLGDSLKTGVVLCDAERRVVYINPTFEDSSGIRADGAIGQELTTVARDQAFGMLATELFERAHPGGSPVTEDFDFSGVSFRMQVTAFGTAGSSAKAYLLIATRNDA